MKRIPHTSRARALLLYINQSGHLGNNRQQNAEVAGSGRRLEHGRRVARRENSADSGVLEHDSLRVESELHEQLHELNEQALDDRRAAVTSHTLDTAVRGGPRQHLHH